MIFANDIKESILKIARNRGVGKFVYLSEVAREIDPENWVKQVDSVELVAEALIREGVLFATKSGEAKEKGYAIIS